MLTLTQARFRYEPYPIGLATEVFARADYDRLVAAYPDEAPFKQLTGAYNKWSLSQRNNPNEYLAFVTNHPVWMPFYRYLKGQIFLDALFACLDQAGIEPPKPPLKTRFEFSSLPGAGGGIEAHTDIPSKVITLIIPMLAPETWDPAWGGGTDMLRPLDPWRRYQDYKEPRKAFEVVQSFPYAPNQAVVFIKTFNSWHAVGPIQGPPGSWRRTLTVNVERMG